MGAHLEPFLPFHVKDLVLQNKGICKSSSGSIWSKVLAIQSMKRRQERRQRMIKRIIYGQAMKRRALLDGSRRTRNGMVRKVKTLKKLVPNGNSMSLDGLFRETADYILSLELQVKIMQIMVSVLNGSNE
ncbi:Transcription factor upbeat1 [Thalictrum thalictroides]|uniref:Transcription factor upbeat1 n=1 Tax=Thalictrum thalictroides TaxID=46969 RepID=A0A7J6W6Y9_THATH|nr:Transcription factor upbeat1 [Thalictrum thalictroides]